MSASLLWPLVWFLAGCGATVLAGWGWQYWRRRRQQQTFGATAVVEQTLRHTYHHLASSVAELATEPQRAAVARLLHVRRTTHAGACRRNGARPDRRSESRFREEAADQQRAPMTSEPEPGRLRSLFAPALASSSKLPQVHLTSALGSDVWRRGRSSRRLRSSKPSRGPCAAVMHGTAGSRPSGLNGAEACLRTRRGRPPP